MLLQICIVAIALITLLRLVTTRNRIRKSVGYTNYRKRRGYVYFYRGIGEKFWEIKIGKARDPIARLRSQKTAKARGIVVLGVVPVRDEEVAEDYIHEKFSYCNFNREWFYLVPQLYIFMRLVSNHELTQEINYVLRDRGRVRQQRQVR